MRKTLVIAALLLSACGDNTPIDYSVLLRPAAATITAGRTVQLGAFSKADVTWKVQEAGGGTIDANGAYTAPATPGTYHVIATSTKRPFLVRKIPESFRTPRIVPLLPAQRNSLGKRRAMRRRVGSLSRYSKILRDDSAGDAEIVLHQREEVPELELADHLLAAHRDAELLEVEPGRFVRCPFYENK